MYDLERWLHAGFIGAVIGILHQLQDNVVVLVVQLLAQQPGSIGNRAATANEGMGYKPSAVECLRECCVVTP